MKRIHKILLSVASGLLLTAGWPEHGFPLLLFVAFIPLLIIEYQLFKKRAENSAWGIAGYLALAFFIWNLLDLYWLYNAAFVAVAAALFFNVALMGGAFLLFHITHRKLGDQPAIYVALIGYFLSYEYLHLNWDLNFPWMNLGHAFGCYPQWVQWYEYTGIFGGSLWILTVNILLFLFIRDKFLERKQSKNIYVKPVIAAIVIIVPIIFSIIVYRNYTEKQNPVDVVVVQPNLDPYNEQYELSPMAVTERMLTLTAQKADSAVDFAVFPESAIQEHIWEDQFDFSPSLTRMRDFLKNYPQLNIITGLSSQKSFAPNEHLTETARKFTDSDAYYDAYNTALFIGNDGKLQLHHKTKLAPGVERMPYLHVFGFLEHFALDLGGTVGSLGVDKVQKPFTTQNKATIAPLICYESAYGEFIGNFIKNGANVIFIITNDGWWKNTPGHRQHLLFAPLRAIETRRSIARSANTGTSCFINQRGDIFQPTPYWQQAVIRQKINLNDKITFYVKYGDYIGKIFLAIAGVFLLVTFYFFSKKHLY